MCRHVVEHTVIRASGGGGGWGWGKSPHSPVTKGADIGDIRWWDTCSDSFRDSTVDVRHYSVNLFLLLLLLFSIRCKTLVDHEQSLVDL